MSKDRNQPEPTATPKRCFTIDEANAMLPLVKAITVDLVNLSNEVIDRRERLAMLTGGRDLDGQDLYSQELAQVQQELERDVERLREYAEELRQLGVEPRNAPKGIIDFPARLEDRDIFLCWKYGEEEVLHWHESDSGFAGRQPIFAQVAADTETDDDGLSPD
jgi:hypothetical protein